MAPANSDERVFSVVFQISVSEMLLPAAQFKSLLTNRLRNIETNVKMERSRQLHEQAKNRHLSVVSGGREGDPHGG
jgi:hypothetical protein